MNMGTNRAVRIHLRLVFLAVTMALVLPGSGHAQKTTVPPPRPGPAAPRPTQPKPPKRHLVGALKITADTSCVVVVDSLPPEHLLASGVLEIGNLTPGRHSVTATHAATGLQTAQEVTVQAGDAQALRLHLREAVISMDRVRREKAALEERLRQAEIERQRALNTPQPTYTPPPQTYQPPPQTYAPTPTEQRPPPDRKSNVVGGLSFGVGVSQVEFPKQAARLDDYFNAKFGDIDAPSATNFSLAISGVTGELRMAVQTYKFTIASDGVIDSDDYRAEDRMVLTPSGGILDLLFLWYPPQLITPYSRIGLGAGGTVAWGQAREQRYNSTYGDCLEKWSIDAFGGALAANAQLWITQGLVVEGAFEYRYLKQTMKCDGPDYFTLDLTGPAAMVGLRLNMH